MAQLAVVDHRCARSRQTAVVATHEAFERQSEPLCEPPREPPCELPSEQLFAQFLIPFLVVVMWMKVC